MKRLFVAMVAVLVFLSPARAFDFTAPQSGRISFAVAKLLEQYHYRQAKLDDPMSEKFLLMYLNALDYNHLIFLQSDVDEFTSIYGKKLDDSLLAGTAEPAFAMFDRYLQRLAECRKIVDKVLLKPFDFTVDESFVPARNKVPWPKDTPEAETLWQLRIKYELLQGRLNKEKPEETIKLIGRRYARLEKTMREFDAEEILQSYLSSLSHSYDPHSEYLSPTEAANFRIQTISLSLSGIGAQLEWDDGNTKIRSLVPGGPAALSKLLKPNDKIVAVAQDEDEMVDVVEMRLNKVVGMIRGKRGTKVRLLIIPASAPDTKKEIFLVRDEIKLKEQFAKARMIEHPGPDGKLHRLGVIALPQFYDNCSKHVEKLMARLKEDKMEGLILDLRNNGGGLLDEAVKLTGLFINKGPVVQVKDHRSIKVLDDRIDAMSYDGPMVVMVNKLSASASEITAAALQDYGRAVLVGDLATHGKGTVQTVLDLDQAIRTEDVPNPGQLKMTVSKFYRVIGSTTQKQGVTPDVVLPSLYDYLDIGEASLENCLSADSINAVPFTHSGSVTNCFAELNKRSKVRVEGSKDFAYLKVDIDEIKKRQDDKSVSLSEPKRLAEKKSQKERTDARKKERLSRKSTQDKILELTLEMVDNKLPMLPIEQIKKDKDPDLEAVPVPKHDVDDPEADADAEPDARFDPQLDEGVFVLQDYTELLHAPLDHEKVALTK